MDNVFVAGQQYTDPVTMILSVLRHSVVLVCPTCGVMLNVPHVARETAFGWMWRHVEDLHDDTLLAPLVFDLGAWVPVGVVPPWDVSSTTTDDPADLDPPQEDPDAFTAIPEESPTCP